MERCSGDDLHLLPVVQETVVRHGLSFTALPNGVRTQTQPRQSQVRLVRPMPARHDVGVWQTIYSIAIGEKEMRFFLLIAVVSVLVQTDPEPYPGQRGHAMPPEGWFCSATAKDVAHKCSCKRMMQSSKEDPACEFGEPPEVQECKVWCHKERCLCPVTCTVPEHHHDMSPKPSPKS